MQRKLFLIAVVLAAGVDGAQGPVAGPDAAAPAYRGASERVPACL